MSKRRIRIFTILTIRVLIYISLIKTKTRRSEVRLGAYRNRRLEAVTDHLNLITQEWQRFIKTIQGSRRRDRSVKIVNTIKTIRSVAGYQSLFLRIIFLFDLAGVPTFLIIERGRNIQVLEHGECSAYRNRVLHIILPIFDQIRFEK